MNLPLLRVLVAHRDRPFSLAELSNFSTDLEGDLSRFERVGYRVEHTLAGIRCVAWPTSLCASVLEEGASERRIGSRVMVLEEAGSTNAIASQAAAEDLDAAEGLAILAEYQTGGRGRHGRSWITPARSSILLSIVMRPPPPLDQAPWLTALGAVAVCEAVGQIPGAEARIKWPNDVRIGGKKVAGVLIERGAGATILGIGLNGNVATDAFPPELRATATSLSASLGINIDRSLLARDLLDALNRLFQEGLTDGPGALDRRWRAHLEPLGRPVVVDSATGRHEGRLIDADLSRGLTLAFADGTTRLIPGAEVREVWTGEAAPSI